MPIAGRARLTAFEGTKSRRRNRICPALQREMTTECREEVHAARELILSAVRRCLDSRFFRYFWS